jgi:hypothetical protein
MLSVCDRYAVGMLSVCYRYDVGMIAMLSVRDRHVDGMDAYSLYLLQQPKYDMRNY